LFNNVARFTLVACQHATQFYSISFLLTASTFN